MPAQLQMYAFADLWHPQVFAWIALLQVAYLLAVGPMREGYRWGPPVPTRQKVWFSVALWLVYLSEGTPLHVLAEHYLFSAHMIQHTLLTMIMPPILLAGTPAWMMRPLVKPRPLRFVARLLTRPAPALLLFNLIYSLWHVPIAYQSTLWWHGFHMVQHAILVFTAILMWMPIASPVEELPQLSDGAKMLYIFIAGVAQIAVFAVITFSDSVLYQFYADAPRIWGLPADWDQQIAGVIMKVGGMGVFIIAWGIIFFRWVAREERVDGQHSIT